MLSILSTPVVIGVAVQQSRIQHLGFSQRVLHSRVVRNMFNNAFCDDLNNVLIFLKFAQAGVLAALLVTMGIQTYVSKHGRYEPVEISEDGKPQTAR
jgi:hypothetical protein